MADTKARDAELKGLLIKLYTHLDTRGLTYTTEEFNTLACAMRTIGNIVHEKTGWFH